MLLGKATKAYPIEGNYLNESVYFNTTMYEPVFKNGNAFLRGLNSDAFNKNISVCYNDWVWFAFKELPIMQIKYHYGDTDDNIFNTTGLINNITGKLLSCAYMTEGLYVYAKQQMVIFASITNFGLSFFQNLLANVVNINYIYESIVQAQTDMNDTAIYYNAGLIANIVLEIPSIETAARDWELPVSEPDHIRLQADSLTALRTFNGIINLTIGMVNGTYP